MSSDPADNAGIQESDVDVLRRLPSLLLREGYVDACGALGISDLRKSEHKVDALPPSLRTLLQLFAFGKLVEPAPLEGVLGQPVLIALRHLGIVLEHSGRYHTAGLQLVPFFGQMFFIPHAHGTEVYFGEDSAALVARLSPSRYARCLDLWAGPGVQSLRLGSLSQSVVAIDNNAAAIACAELNVTLNSLEDRVEIRKGELFDALQPDELFDHVSACPPVLPFPPELAFANAEPAPDDGLLMLRRLLEGLPRVMTESGIAQIIASSVGDDRAPRVCEELSKYAAEHGLQITMAIPARVRLRPGDRLFELLTERCQQLGDLHIDTARLRMTRYLSAIKGEYLYRYFLTISQGRSQSGLQISTYFT